MAIVFATVAEFIIQTDEQLEPGKSRLYLESAGGSMQAAGYFSKFRDEHKTVLLMIISGIESWRLSSQIYIKIPNISLKIKQ